MEEDNNIGNPFEFTFILNYTIIIFIIKYYNTPDVFELSKNMSVEEEAISICTDRDIS